MISILYIASSGNTYNLKTNGILTREANYHTWTWTPNGTNLQYGIRISDFSKAAATYKTKLTFEGNYEYRRELINSLHEDFELDIRTQRPGRIIWGDYYIDGYITQSSTSPDSNLRWTNNDISIYCPYPFWIKEETKSFVEQTVPAGQTFLDYPFDYEYDFYYGNPGTDVWQTGFPFESDFKLTIYGAVVNPRITINNYPYQVNTTLSSGEYLTIDSRNNTIFKYTDSGKEINLFDYRDKTQSVFERIPGGNLRLNWTGAFGFDLTLFEERSEPRDDNENKYKALVGTDKVLTVLED